MDGILPDPTWICLSMARVKIYSILLCPFCYRAKQFLKSKGIAFEEIDVLMQPGRRAEMIELSGGRTAVPQIFVDDLHIGDCDEILALDGAGKFAPLLEAKV